MTLLVFSLVIFFRVAKSNWVAWMTWFSSKRALKFRFRENATEFEKISPFFQIMYLLINLNVLYQGALFFRATSFNNIFFLFQLNWVNLDFMPLQDDQILVTSSELKVVGLYKSCRLYIVLMQCACLHRQQSYISQVL